jgi:hypothetical protein
MTQISRELMQQAGILPKLRLGLKLPKGGVKPTGPHKVKILEDKILKKPDQTGKEIEYVRYVVEENGEKKIYDTKLRDKNNGLSYLVQRFAEISEGEEVVLEMKKQGVKNYIEVTPAGQSASVEVEEEDDDSINQEDIPF